MASETDLLIIGAGPFGLGLAAYCQQFSIDYLMVGKPMGFWKSNMPHGMYLRSGIDWHLDPSGTYTIENFIQSQGYDTDQLKPLSREFYLNYTDWFKEGNQIDTMDFKVHELKVYDNSFTAVSEDGNELKAKNVLVATGFEHYKHLPEEYLEMFPQDRLYHTCDLVNFDKLKRKRCLIIGGRQSAFEWAALLNESGVEQINLCYRHDTPRFTESDWTWVTPLMDRFIEDNSWYHKLTDEEKQALDYRLWVEGRAKLEPWLYPRINNNNVKLYPNSTIKNCTILSDHSLQCTLDQGQQLETDVIILATGYKVDLRKIPFLVNGNILEKLSIQGGFPRLDQNLQSNIPGLYFTSITATRDFGSFFAFTVSVKASANLVGQHLRSTLSTSASSE